MFLIRSSLAGLVVLTLLPIAALAQVRVTEVLADPAGRNPGNQKVEIANVGNSPVDISGWSICVQLNYQTFTAGLDPLQPNETFVIHISATGTSDDNNHYTGTFFPNLTATDSFGLYGPNAVFENGATMRSFVQWGSGNRPRSFEAVSGGWWDSASDFVNAAPDGQSMQLCGVATNSSAWELAAPTIGTYPNNCAVVPTELATWGGVKTRFP